MTQRRWQVSGVLLLLLTTSVVAEDDITQGEMITRQGNGQGAAACVTCHGAEGQGNAGAGFPQLAGKPAAYLAKQLHDIQAGTRESPIMQPIAKALSDADIQAVSAYYTSLGAQELPTEYRPADPGDAGQWLANRGDWANTIPACNQCHGPNGQGVGEHFPRLAGQHASYLQAQLNAWRNGTRHNDPNGLMTGIAKRLSEEQITLIADYYANLPARLESAQSASSAEDQ